MKKARGDFWLLGVKISGGVGISGEEVIWTCAMPRNSGTLASNLQHDSQYLKTRNGVVVCAVPSEPFSLNSLFKREKTGNFFNFGP